MSRVLLIDDVQDNITFLAFDLKDDGYEVVTAQNGRQCLEKAKTRPKPDIILLDIQMPELTGIETLKRLKKDQRTAEIPVIIVSAADSDETTIKCIDLGAHDFICKPIVYPVLAARMRSALRLSNALGELEQANLELSKLATTDPLTGALNRRHFFTLSEMELIKARRYEHPLSAIMIDIDHFKQINDTYGHIAGDIALQAFVDCCRKAARAHDVLGRLGGEEFALCCSNTDLKGARLLAERIRASCEALRIKTQEFTFSMTVSIGVTERAEDENLDQLLLRADALLYRAKSRGRNRVVAGHKPPSDRTALHA